MPSQLYQVPAPCGVCVLRFGMLALLLNRASYFFDADGPS